MKLVHRIMYFIQFFFFIFCPFTGHLHAPLIQYHTNPSILKKRLFDTDSRVFSFTFRFDPTLTRYRLRNSMVCNTVFLLYIFSTSQFYSKQVFDNTLHTDISRTLAFFAKEEIDTWLSYKFEYQTTPSFDDPEREGF